MYLKKLNFDVSVMKVIAKLKDAKEKTETSIVMARFAKKQQRKITVPAAKSPKVLTEKNISIKSHTLSFA